MKKSLVTLLLAFATCAVAVQASADVQSAPAGQQDQQAGQPAAGAAKSFKDPAESNAFYAAYNTADPTAKATALESFLQSYPNSIAKQDALDILLQTYQALGNTAKMQDTATRSLQSDPKNLTALAVLTYLNNQAAQAGNAQAWPTAAQYAQTGLQALQTANKPEGISDADWTKRKQTFQVLFQNTIGLNATQQKDYPTAQKALAAVVQETPDDLTAVYYLAQSELEQKPIVVDGLYWGARAINLAKTKNAPPQAIDQISKYVKSRYTRYHGSDQGFTELVAAATAPTLPQGFTVAPAPSPADQAADMMKTTPVKQMSFAEWEFILTSGNQQASDTVWSGPDGIKGKPLAMQGWVATASAKSLSIFGTEDAKNDNKPDIILNLTEAIPAARLPKAGTLIKFQGTPDSFTPAPNFVMTMTDGVVALPAAPKAPVTHHTTRKKQ